MLDEAFTIHSTTLSELVAHMIPQVSRIDFQSTFCQICCFRSGPCESTSCVRSRFNLASRLFSRSTLKRRWHMAFNPSYTIFDRIILTFSISRTGMSLLNGSSVCQSIIYLSLGHVTSCLIYPQIFQNFYSKINYLDLELSRTCGFVFNFSMF